MAVTDTIEVVFTAQHTQFMSAVNQMSAAIKLQTDAFEKLSEKVNDSASVITKSNLGMVAFGETVKGAFSSVLQASSDFEVGFARLKRLVDDQSELGNFQKSIQGIISTIPLASKELFHFGEEALKAGATTVESFKDLTTLGAQLQANVGGPIGDLLTQMIRFTKVFGEGIDQVRNTVDITTKLANAFSTNEQEILKITQRFAPMAKALGFSKAEALGLGNAMKELNVTSESGGTVIAQFFAKIQEGIGGNNKILQAFGKITNQTSEQFVKSFKKDPATAFELFIGNLEKIVKSGGYVGGALKALGLESVRQMIIFGQLAGAGDTFRASLEKAREIITSVQTALGQSQIVWGTTAAEIQRFKNNVELLKVELGKGLNSQIGFLANLLTDLTRIIKDSPLFQSTTAQTILLISEMTLGLAGAWTILKAALIAVGLPWATISASMLTAAPYAAAAAGVLLLASNWDKVKSSMEQSMVTFNHWVHKKVMSEKDYVEWASQPLPVARPTPLAHYETAPEKGDPGYVPTPDERIAEALQKHARKMESINILYAEGGKKIEKLKEELASLEHVYHNLSDIEPLPKADLQMFAKDIARTKADIGNMKEEVKVDLKEANIQKDLFIAEAISNSLGDSVEFARQSVQMLKGAISKKIETEFNKKGSNTFKVGDMGFTTDMFKNMNDEKFNEIEGLPPLIKMYNEYKEKLSEVEAIQAISTKSEAFRATVIDLEKKATSGLITELEKEKGIREASLSTLAAYEKLKNVGGTEYDYVSQRGMDAKMALKELTIKDRDQVELQKVKNEVMAEAQTILDGLQGSQYKYATQIDALNYLLANTGFTQKQYNSAYEELTMKMVTSNPQYKDAIEVFGALGNAATEAFEQMLTQGKLTSEGLKGIVKSIITTLGKLVEKILITKITMMILGSGTSPIAGSTGITNSSGIQAFPTSTGPSSFAGGGIVSQTGYAMLHAPEAVVPIEGGKIPVEMKSSSSAMTNVTIINVTDMATAQALSQDKNAIINIISRNIEERGPVYRSLKVANTTKG
jgi:TP901 family phage tail tape measure protein